MYPYSLPNVLPNGLESRHRSVPAAAVPCAAPSISETPAPVWTFSLSSLVGAKSHLGQLIVHQRSALMGRGLGRSQQRDILSCPGSGHCARITPLLNGKLKKKTLNSKLGNAKTFQHRAGTACPAMTPREASCKDSTPNRSRGARHLLGHRPL